ncbi:MAG: TrkA family potassium uptake protein [Nitrospirota bacterium]|jgi:trk system potassium uptake protein TrkA
MRIAFVGAGELSVMTARALIDRGNEVIIIEKEKDRIDDLSEQLDCGFINGDGSKPPILKEAGPESTDILFCLTGNDQVNIIASLVGRSMGFSRVVTKITDTELEHICTELGLTDTIIPTRTISRFLADMAAGRDVFELSTMLRGEARVFSFVAREEHGGKISELGLPGAARIICYYRDGEFHLAGGEGKLQKGDEVVVLTRGDALEELRERFAPKAGARGDDRKEE